MAAAVLMLDFLHRHRVLSKKKIHLEKKSSSQKKVKGMHPQKKKICRICLKNGEIPIFNKDCNDKIAEHIKTFADITVNKKDDLPKYLCGHCHNFLVSAILFRQQAKETDKKLQRNHIFVAATVDIAEHSDANKVEDSNEGEAKDDAGCQNYDIAEGDCLEYHCKRCQLAFSNCMEYAEHVKTALHRRSRVPCPQCKATFVASYLHIHMLRAHSTEKPFVCEVCGKSFSVKVAFKRHLHIHSDDLPYECSECPYRGRFSESLKAHMRIHTGEKPYSCHHCASQFVCASNLKKHLRTHQTHFEHKCDQCYRGFHTVVKMKEHVRVVHAGLKEHQCDTCGKAFGYRKQLMKHTRKVHQRPKMRQGKLPLYLQLENKLQARDEHDIAESALGSAERAPGLAESARQ